MEKAVHFSWGAQSSVTGCYIQVIRERWKNFSKTKPQATEQQQNPVNVKSKSCVFWSTNYTGPQGINVNVYKEIDKYRSWSICRLNTLSVIKGKSALCGVRMKARGNHNRQSSEVLEIFQET